MQITYYIELTFQTNDECRVLFGEAKDERPSTSESRLSYSIPVSYKNEETLIDTTYNSWKKYLVNPNRAQYKRFLLGKLYLEEMMDWKGRIIELCYLLKRLSQENCLTVYKKQIWKLGSQLFTHNGEKLKNTQLSGNQNFKKCLTAEKRKGIDRLIEQLKMLAATVD